MPLVHAFEYLKGNLEMRMFPALLTNNSHSQQQHILYMEPLHHLRDNRRTDGVWGWGSVPA